jgi:hypothetical protein
VVRFEVPGVADEHAVEHARVRVESVGGQLTVSEGLVAGAVSAR